LKVFISSVTYLLKDERNALTPFLRLFDHEPLMFEDFLSQDRSGREACLSGVETADVYVLLLGPRYGDPFSDTGLSPTAEEFRRARARGIPILVFAKTSNELDEPAQLEFKAEVGHYVNGRFWKVFADPLSLNLAVGEALKALPPRAGILRLAPVTSPVTVPWLAESGFLAPQVSAPVLEAHVVPVGPTTLAGALALAAAAAALARDARASSFVSEGEPMVVGSDNKRAWAIRPAERSGGFLERTVEEFRGLVSNASGTSTSFRSLTTDFVGALIDRASLQRDIAQLISIAAPHAALESQVAVAVGLSNAERVWEGDPQQVGTRTGGAMRSREGLTIRVGSDFAVESQVLGSLIGEVAAELAARVINEIQNLPPH
jgi:uncharacterized protein DUF4062